MTMGKSRSQALVALCATVGLAAGGCSQIGMLKGKMAFQDANKFYQGQDYRAAAAKYEETIAECRGSDPDCTDPRLTPAYFFLGNSYDQQYRAVKKGEAANDALLTKAIENYKKAAVDRERPEDQAAGARLSGQLLRPGQAERPGAGRAHPPEHDRDGSQRNRPATSAWPTSTSRAATTSAPSRC